MDLDTARNYTGRKLLLLEIIRWYGVLSVGRGDQRTVDFLDGNIFSLTRIVEYVAVQVRNTG